MKTKGRKLNSVVDTCAVVSEENQMDPLLKPRQRTRHSVENTVSQKEKKKKPILKFIGSGFRYNGRVALAISPGIASILLFGGSPVLTVLFCTLFVVYLLDLLDKPHAIFLTVWGGFGVLNLLMFSQGIPLVQVSFVNIFIVALFSLAVLLLAAWVSLQFRWLQETSAGPMIVLERVLFTLSPTVFSLLATYTIVSIVEINNGPFILLGCLCYVQYLLNQPLASCFRPSENQLICNHYEMIAHSISLVLLPVLFHIGLFHRNLFIMYHIVNFLALLCFSALFLAHTGRLSLLHDIGFRMNTEKLVDLITVVSGIILVFCFEYRVIFGSFYYSIPIAAPLSYVVVTIGCYTGAALAYLFFIGEAKRIGRLGCSIIASICAFTVGCTLRMGIIALPVFITASVFLVSFYFYRKAIDYVVFCILSAIVIVWFVFKSYWFLQFDFSGFSLQFVSVLLVVVAILSLVIPANVFAPQRGPVMALYALAVTGTETILFFTSVDIYPFYMVLLTSVIGIWITIHLENNKFINRITSWVCISAYVSKLIMFVAIARENVIGSFILTLCVLAPYYCHSGRRTLSVRAGILYSVLFAFITLGTTWAVGGSILFVLIGRIPPVSMLWGVYLITWGGCCVALSFSFFADSVMARRLSSTLTLLGMSLLVVDPEFGLFVSVGRSSPLLFIFAVLITLLCSQSRYAGIRAFYVISMSISCAVLLVNTTLPSSWIFYFCFSFVFLPFFAVINWLSFPSSLSTNALPFVYIGFLIMFPLVIASGSAITSSFPPRVQGEYMRQLRSALIGLYGGMSIFLALLIKLKLSKKQNNNVKTPFDLKWIAEIGNVSSLLGYGVSCYFCLHSLGHSESSLFLLAPILLLLQTDKFLFSWLREENRYAPVVACCTLCLFSMSVYKIFYMALIRWKWKFLILKEFMFLLSVFPSNYLFPRYLSNLQRQPTLWWLIVAPLNFVGLFATFPATYWLAVEGLLLSAAYFLIVFLVNRKDGKNFI